MASTPTVELITEVRKWNREWDSFARDNKKIKQPMGVNNFAEYLDSKYKIEIK
jgi:hypothetical protein